MPGRIAAFAVSLLLLVLAFGTTACHRSRHAPATAPPPATLGTTAGLVAPAPLGGEADDAAATMAQRGDSRDAERAPADEPALGTAFGEHRHSHVVTAPFVRESDRPAVILSLFYDDIDRVRELARTHGAAHAPSSSIDAGDGVLVVSLLDDGGRALAAADIDGRRIAVGEPGQRYAIAVDNRSPERLEIVASVDGLDVIDGEVAALHKRGYVIEPFSSVTIEGWRTSTDSVAAFRFSALSHSFAARTGSARNAGVVGVAFFRERGARGTQRAVPSALRLGR